MKEKMNIGIVGRGRRMATSLAELWLNQCVTDQINKCSDNDITLFYDKYLKKINNKDIDGLKVTLKCIEHENINMLCAFDDNHNVYVLKMNEIKSNQ